MNNIDNQSYILLKNSHNLGASKKVQLELFNANIKIVKEKNNNDKQQDIIKKKKIIKYKLPIPNKKKFIKKENNIPKNKYIKIDKKIVSNEHKNKSIVKRKNSGIVRRTKNYQLYVSKSGKISPNNTINIEKNRNGLCNPYNPGIYSPKIKPIKPNSQSQKSISNVNNKIIIRNILNNNSSNYEMKSFQYTLKNKVLPLSFRNENMNNNTINKNINYNINSSNFNRNINYTNNENFNYINIITNDNKILFNNKYNNILERKYNSKSPSNHLNKRISPLKKRNVNNGNRCEIKIIKRNSLNSSSNNQINLKESFPNNISFHEIIHFNSPKKFNKSFNNKEKNQYNKKNRKNSTIKIDNNYMNECIEDNNNFNRISHHKLIQNQSLNNIKRRHLSFDTNIPHFSESFMDKNQIFINNLLNENYNDTYFIGHNYSHRNSQKKYLILSRQNSKSDFNSQYIENDDKEEKPEKIHYFGEQMLNRNKNYNYENEDTIQNNEYKNNEKFIQNIKFKKKSRICLRKDKSQNNIIKRNHNNTLKPLSHTNLYHEITIKNSTEKSKKNNINNKNNNQNINKNRYKHNIINRKRMRKLAIEREQSAEFISKFSNKNKKNGSSKEKASYYESIIDNDSINEIIKEFEKEIKEIEESEKKNGEKNEDKIDNQKDKVIHQSQSENLIYSFYSENDHNRAQDSNNNSKAKPKKKHYFKTKNIDMEKNYDFIIYPTKKKN